MVIIKAEAARKMEAARTPDKKEVTAAKKRSKTQNKERNDEILQGWFALRNRECAKSVKQFLEEITRYTCAEIFTTMDLEGKLQCFKFNQYEKQHLQVLTTFV